MRVGCVKQSTQHMIAVYSNEGYCTDAQAANITLLATKSQKHNHN